MAVNINKVREKYVPNRQQTLESAAELFGIDLSEWTFTELSAREEAGNGNDVFVIFESTLTKEGEEVIYISEIIDYHRLAYSYNYRYGEEDEDIIIEPDEEDE